MDCDLRAKESVKTTRRRRADKDLKVPSVPPPPPPPVTAPLRRSHRLGLIGGEGKGKRERRNHREVQREDRKPKHKPSPFSIDLSVKE